eukprot:4589484-Pyramimonas_sp.AAC.1
MNKSFVENTVAFNMYASLVTSHIAQFFQISSRVLKAERDGHQLLARAPRFAFPPLAYTRLKYLGMPAECRSLKVHCAVTIVRAAHLSERCHALASWIDQVRESDEAVIASRYLPAQESS